MLLYKSIRETSNHRRKKEKFACKNFVPDCDYVAIEATKEEAPKKAMEHGDTVHTDLLKDMTKDQTAEFVQKVEASIETV